MSIHTSALLKSSLHNAIAKGIYNEIQTRSSRYYYFLGKTLAWSDELVPPSPIDSLDYSNITRNEIITMKEISSTDVAFVVPRVDWIVGTQYDMYDDSYGDILDGISLDSSGSGYIVAPSVVFTGGGGEGAAAIATILDGFVIDITLTSAGTGYVSTPTVTLVGAVSGGIVATASTRVSHSTNNINRIEDTNFYVVTDEFNVYKCLDNNNGAPSSHKLSGGTGYTSGATITITDPIIANPWIDSYGVILGQKIKHNGNMYNVSNSGVLASPAPTHKSGIVANGTAGLEYIGTTAKATAIFTGDVLTAIDLIGSVLSVSMVSGGLGYTSAPTVTVSGTGSGVIATAVMTGTSVSHVVINDSGDDFTTIPTVAFGTQWTADTVLTLNEQVFQANRLYTVTVAGTTGASAPTHTSSSAANGSVTLEYVGSPATGTVNLRYGAGYSTVPEVTVSPVSGGDGAAAHLFSIKTEAKIVPILSGGALVGITIEDPGIGYTYVNLTVSGDGTDAKLTADLSPGDVSTLQANTELLTIDGRIMSIKVNSGGYGYTSATVTIDGDGSGATATVTTELGRVTKITMTNYGSGYRWAKVNISGYGKGAKARAIITEFGGHGRDSITGLYAKSLMFYTNMSRDLNQGFAVVNDFRQLGIIKNPRKFGSTYPTDSALLSACYAVSGTINTTQFEQDMIIYMSPNNRRFRIVNLTSNSALIQSLDNAQPVVGSTFINSSNNTFSVDAVTVPTVDKYSGDILFIDNKQAFTPTTDQTVTLRTVIKF